VHCSGHWTLPAFGRGGSFLAGGSCTIADLAVYAYSHRAEDAGILLADYPAVIAWLDRVANAIGPGYPVHPYSIDPHSA
jgi:glutathione S-transferase